MKRLVALIALVSFLLVSFLLSKHQLPMHQTLSQQTPMAQMVAVRPSAKTTPPTNGNSAFQNWITGAFLHPSTAAAPQAGLDVIEQDFLSLQLGKSVLGTPLQIGTEHFTHGLGTHVVSALLVRLPAKAKSFSARVGIDNNNDTKGIHGAVVFVVEANGKELFRSGVCKGGDAPVTVDIALPNVQTLTLRVLVPPEGAVPPIPPGQMGAGEPRAWGQSDWADASVVLADGKQVYLDELSSSHEQPGLSTSIPFSFLYNGKASEELLPTWKRTVTSEASANGKQRHLITYRDPQTGLEVRCELTQFTGYPAVDWVMTFKNTGKADTPVIEHILPLNLGVGTPPGAVVFHHSNGSTAGPTDYLPMDDTVAPNAHMDIAPNGGRSSNGALPFFNFEWNGGGLVGAIGWSGQWALHLARSAGRQVTLQAGQQTTHLLLHPGEQIRTPRILLVSWHGADYLSGSNILRRLLLADYVPREQVKPAVPPVSGITWFYMNAGNAVTEQNQLALMPGMEAAGLDAFWMDAGWFQGGWPNGAGNWFPDSARFPHGLKPIGDAAHAHGMKFVLWFEPERVTPQSLVAKQHPEWVMKYNGNGQLGNLFALGDPKARAWLTDILSKDIGDWGVDVFRNDFNVDPLPFWQAADATDRQGMAENQYVTGLYAMWDDLRRRHPGLAIDDCASGGRRIDLEMLTRSYPLWQSDSQCSGHPIPTWDQAQNAGLSLYVPLHCAGTWAFDPYSFWSVVSSGSTVCVDVSGSKTLQQTANAMLGEMKTLRPYTLGDYYPLLPVTTDDHHWCAWQYHRPDLGGGYVLCFRRPQSPQATATVALHGLDPGADYQVTNAASHVKTTLTGAELAHYAIQIPSQPGSVLLTYKRVP